jgi:phosphonate transport system substrate-binding protein
MDRTIWVGAVAYDPKVVTIWEGMRRYFHEEAHLPVEVVLFQSYEMQVAALLAGPADSTPRIDIAWNTNLAYLQADSWSDHRCRPIAMRDTDLGWRTIIIAASGGPVSNLSDLKKRTLALGSRDSGHAAILPVHFLEREGLVEGRDYRTLCSPFWKTVRTERLVPEGGLTEVWTSPPYNHCMSTSRPNLDLSLERTFGEALSGMNYDDPTHRAVLDAEGLHHWVEPHLDGYTALREACVRQGFFTNPVAKSAAE